MAAVPDNQQLCLADPNVAEAVRRGIIESTAAQVTYNLATRKSYDFRNPEEWVRCRTIAFLIIKKSYPTNRMKTEVVVPRRTPHDSADIVVYKDDRCREPYLVAENKRVGVTRKETEQGIEQLFGNANSLRVPLGLYDGHSESVLFDVAGHAPTERKDNRCGSRDAIPEQYGDVPEYTYIAGTETDIGAVKPSVLESKIRRAHSLIWSGGRRDPLAAFDEWSKLLFAKVMDERNTPSGQPRRFQVGKNETTAKVATRIHELFNAGCRSDPSIFPPGISIQLTDKKIFQVVKVLQDVSFVRTDVDSIGKAFEDFFGSVFRGELGQYFTMRQLARFVVAVLAIDPSDFVLDPTAGSGGFLLEALLQVWHRVDRDFAGQPQSEIDRTKVDFALNHVFGIEIHDVLARICKINLLLHHDGHTNVEGNRSCLDSVFSRPRLNPPQGQFSCIVGNPPFGDDVAEGDEDHLGANELSNFTIASGRDNLPSEQVILERCVDLLEDGGRLGLILPDGLLNNQGFQSNCPQVRSYLVTQGRILAIVSLPDYAFRKSGAQNKTSILFFRKFTSLERVSFEQSLARHKESGLEVAAALAAALTENSYRVFLAEGNHVGYTSTGASSTQNDLYSGTPDGQVDRVQVGTILGEYRTFVANPANYGGHEMPDCMAIEISELWNTHASRRMDPKYFLFKKEERAITPAGWIRVPMSQVMDRRESIVQPETKPDDPVQVMTVSQAGEIRAREAGKGRNPPEWLGMYFEDSPSTWYAAQASDVVFSSIDLWKGCIAVVPAEFEGALVTKEFPIYKVTDPRLNPNFLSCLLRSRYYQRAFRAITTGHSNRRRTQVADFEALEICFPPDPVAQMSLIQDVLDARKGQRDAQNVLKQAMLRFSDVVDGRGAEELPEVDMATENGDEE